MISSSKIRILTSESADSVDLTYLSSMCDGDPAFMREMITSFINDVPDILAGITLKLEEKDWEGVGKLAHKLKPAVQFMGLSKTLEAIRTIEANCKKDQTREETVNLIKLVIHNIQTATPELREQLDKNMK